ncbi:migration and invasion-inhibitory protein [Sorex araneus]|uniref:migration and invasion-inhibitory protein n=1 Tax=Sorex araneus TaxID=42254 RepID=UPI0024333980|nr:migration and invasion-inhibitory protein [Sorex araneus]
MAEAEVLRLRELNLALLRKLTAGQETVRRLVAKAQAAAGLSVDSSSGCASEAPSSREVSSASPVTSSAEEARLGDAGQGSGPGSARSETSPLPPAEHPRQESPGPGTPHSTPLGSAADSKEPESSESEDLGFLDARAHQSSPVKDVTDHTGPPVPESSWRLRPYLGYDWIAGSLDIRSPVSSKPEVFFSKLQEFREANQEDCFGHPHESLLAGVPAPSNVEGDHECIYCYRVNRRLFLEPSDPDSPCRLCRKPRGQGDPSVAGKPVQVRVSVPMSALDPPHRPRIHRRKSFDASDTLALPRHCLLGWDILPPKPEQSCAPENLDLWSCVPADSQRQRLPAASSSL